MKGEVRIIAGKWRGRKLKFPAVAGLRPTTDRIRETLFNWLTPYLPGSHCLDLFAGSGALGLEALSRGAASAILVDQNPQIVTYLKKQLDVLQTDAAKVYCAEIPSAASFTKSLKTDFNIIFLDPPFHHNLLASCCHWLEQEIHLAPDALIYVEAEASLHPLPVPNYWELKRAQTAGQVKYCLFRRHSSTTY